MKKLVFVPLATLLLTFSVSIADDFDEGLSAYNKGDYQTAMKIWKPLAEQGNARAQNNLAVMYDNGEGVPQDDKEAVKWYQLAAEQGNATAQTGLGSMYYNGHGVIQDYVIAFMWWNLSAAQGNEIALSKRDKLTKKMTSSQIAEAQKLSRECLKKEYKNCY